jgi:hypothetical protein
MTKRRLNAATSIEKRSLSFVASRFVSKVAIGHGHTQNIVVTEVDDA